MDFRLVPFFIVIAASLAIGRKRRKFGEGMQELNTDPLFISPFQGENCKFPPVQREGYLSAALHILAEGGVKKNRKKGLDIIHSSNVGP